MGFKLRIWVVLIVVLVAVLFSGGMQAQIYVANNSAGTIGEYNLDGSTINASLVTGLTKPWGMVVSGSSLYVACSQISTVGLYDATTGAVSNASLISGLNNCRTLALSGADLYVGNYYSGTIGKYTASGATVNASLISGVYPGGIAISGTTLYVANCYTGTIGKYDATTGAALNASLVSGLNWPWGIAVYGSSLFVANSNAGTIGEYDAATGAVVNASLISGLKGPQDIIISGSHLYVLNIGDGSIGEYNLDGSTVNASLLKVSGAWGLAVVSTPEPSTWMLVGVGTIGLALARRRRSDIKQL